MGPLPLIEASLLFVDVDIQHVGSEYILAGVCTVDALGVHSQSRLRTTQPPYQRTIFVSSGGKAPHASHHYQERH